MTQKLLVLKVIDCPEEYIGAKQIEMSEVGGTIGRNSACAFYLPDHNKYISGTHALITTYNGGFYLSDVSTNGTFINGQRISKNQPSGLHDGDKVVLGRYEIDISIEAQNLHIDLAADIMPELNTSDPVTSLDIILPAKQDGDDGGRLETLFEELDEQELYSDEPLDHLNFLTRNDTELIDDEMPAEETVTETLSLRQIPDDSDSIFSEMDIPNLIPEDWLQAEKSILDIDRDGDPQDHIEPQSTKVDYGSDSQHSKQQDEEHNKNAEIVEPIIQEPTALINLDGAIEPMELNSASSNSLQHHVNTHYDVDYLQGDESQAMSAFMRGLGENRSDSIFTSAEWHEQLGKCLKICIDKMSADLHEATHFTKSGSCYTGSPENILASMAELFKQGALQPVELLEQVIDEVDKHRCNLKYAHQALAYQQSLDCDPAAFKENYEKKSLFSKKAKLWNDYREHYQCYARPLMDKNESHYNKRLKEHYEKLSQDEYA